MPTDLEHDADFPPGMVGEHEEGGPKEEGEGSGCSTSSTTVRDVRRQSSSWLSEERGAVRLGPRNRAGVADGGWGVDRAWVGTCERPGNLGPADERPLLR